MPFTSWKLTLVMKLWRLVKVNCFHLLDWLDMSALSKLKGRCNLVWRITLMGFEHFTGGNRNRKTQFEYIDLCLKSNMNIYIWSLNQHKKYYKLKVPENVELQEKWLYCQRSLRWEFKKIVFDQLPTLWPRWLFCPLSFINF